jgi:sulfur-oxidizing protein SoxY
MKTIQLHHVHSWLFFLLMYALVPTVDAAPIINQWDVIKESYFSHQTVTHADHEISIEAPAQAEDAALVPFAFVVKLTNEPIETVYVFTDANPILLTATLHMEAQQKEFKLATRIRLEANSLVRVIAKTNSGKLLMKSVAIKTPGGGCGGGEMTDEAKLRATAGQIKMRWFKPGEKEQASLALHIKHPMRTGFERTFQGYFAKAWFIQKLDFFINNQPYFKAILGPGISADPYLRFHLPEQKIDVLQVEVIDNEGQHFQQVFNDAM